VRVKAKSMIGMPWADTFWLRQLWAGILFEEGGCFQQTIKSVSLVSFLIFLIIFGSLAPKNLAKISERPPSLQACTKIVQTSQLFRLAQASVLCV